jgi:hypothetical protein
LLPPDVLLSFLHPNIIDVKISANIYSFFILQL